MAKLVTQTMYVSELTPKMIAEGWERSENKTYKNMKADIKALFEQRQFSAGDSFHSYQAGFEDGYKSAIKEQVDVVDLLAQRKRIEDKIRLIDPLALINYELEQLGIEKEEQVD